MESALARGRAGAQARVRAGRLPVCALCVVAAGSTAIDGAPWWRSAPVVEWLAAVNE
jgi:hypothetical protein